MKLGLGLGFTPMQTTNPLLTLDNIINYTDFTNASAYTYSSGSDVDSVTSAAGSIHFSNTETTPMEYDASLFGGKGGIKTADSDSDISYNAGYNATSTMTIGLVIETSNVGAVTADIFSIGNANFGGNRSKITLAQATNPGFLTYGTNEALSFETLVNSGSSGIFLVILKYNNASSLDFHVRHAGGDNTGSFNPDDGFTAATHLWLGDRGANVGLTNVAFAESFQTSDILNTNETLAALDYWEQKYL